MSLKLIILAIFCLVTSDVTWAYYKGSSYMNGIEYAYFDDGHDDVLFCEARMGCAVWSEGSDLAKVSSQSINDHVEDLTADNGYKTVWIGATDMYGENYWKWTDGTDVTWTKWWSGEPNDSSNEDCVGMNYEQRGYWNDWECDNDRMGYVCQLDATRAKPLHNSVLSFNDASSPISFSEAKAQCDKLGARLVKIESADATEMLVNKMKGYKRTRVQKYWIDNGQSECSMINGAILEDQACNEKTSGYICETVRPHDVLVSNGDPVVSESGNLEIECTASGFPHPNVVWYKEGRVVADQITNESSALLKITDANKSDAGLYVCHANNGGTTSKALARLTVTPKV